MGEGFSPIETSGRKRCRLGEEERRRGGLKRTCKFFFNPKINEQNCLSKRVLQNKRCYWTFVTFVHLLTPADYGIKICVYGL